MLAVRTRWVDYKDSEYNPYAPPFATHPPLGASPIPFLMSIMPNEANICPSPSHRDQIEPGWHLWMSYAIDKPPSEDPLVRTGQRAWELTEHRPNATLSRAAYRPYST